MFQIGFLVLLAEFCFSVAWQCLHISLQERNKFGVNQLAGQFREQAPGLHNQ